MADPTVRSYASAATSTDNPVAAPKPTGLTAGDLIVIALGMSGGNTSGSPTGFTQQVVNSVVNQRIELWTKIAAAGDVSGSGWNIPNSGSVSTKCLVWAVRDAGEIEYAAIAENGNAYTYALAALDPEAANDLLLGFLAIESINPICWTENNNPSWTKDYEDQTGSVRCRGYHATYASDASTGAIAGGSDYKSSGAFACLAVAPGGEPPAATPDLFLDGVWG